jgi:hypothetical protein
VRAWRCLTLLLCALELLNPGGGRAFPPYRSTDAETADPWTLEARFGLVRMQREGDRNDYASRFAV